MPYKEMKTQTISNVFCGLFRDSFQVGRYHLRTTATVHISDQQIRLFLQSVRTATPTTPLCNLTLQSMAGSSVNIETISRVNLDTQAGSLELALIPTATVNIVCRLKSLKSGLLSLPPKCFHLFVICYSLLVKWVTAFEDHFSDIKIRNNEKNHLPYPFLCVPELCHN